MSDYQKKTYYCPRCGRKAGEYCGRGETPLRARCNKCEKIVVYFPQSGKTKLRDIPERNTSSGMTFY